MARYDTLKRLDWKPYSGRNRQSIFWNFSGSTLIHILLILGLGFYVALPALTASRHTISIELNTDAALNTRTQLGEGAPQIQPASQAQEPNRQKVVSAPRGTFRFNNGTFLVEQENLIREIKDNNKIIEQSERIGFLGVFDVHPAYREYQQYWQQYVSRFGTENYPSKLLQKGLSGSLELDIAIDKLGVVRSTDIHRSSGNIDIDMAAIEIAMLAGPYLPLPEEMAKDIDVLHIIRTWDFNGSTLTSRSVEE